MLVLTHNDELNRTYTEGERLHIKSSRSKNNPQSDDTKGNQSSTGENRLVFKHKDDKTFKDSGKNIISKVKVESPMLKETRDEVPSTSVTITSIDSLSFKHVKGCDKEKQLSDVQGNKMEKYKSLNQNPEKKSNFCMIQRPSRGRLSADRNKENEEKKMASTYNLLTSLHKEHATTSLTSPVQSLSTNATGLISHSTITAWEASWNVTNAIQVC